MKDSKEGKTYLHIKYSHDGKTFSKDNGKEIAEWVGVYVDNIAEDSNNFEAYEWKRSKKETKFSFKRLFVRFLSFFKQC